MNTSLAPVIKTMSPPVESAQDNPLKILLIGTPKNPTLKDLFSEIGFPTIAAPALHDVHKWIRLREAGIVVLSVAELDEAAMETCARIRKIDCSLPVLICAQHASTANIIEIAQRGIFECLVPPLDGQRLKRVVTMALEISRCTHSNLSSATRDSIEFHQDGLVGDSPVMHELYKRIGRVASLEDPLLVTGENGTGKELVARYIHLFSHRHQQPFCVINCAAFPEAILERELFGYESGTEAGPEPCRAGKLEQYSGGTIFLDEIGEMSPTTQAKLLRLLEARQFERIGGRTPLMTDVRIIAATNRDLSRDAAEGRFRQDIYYRLNGFAIHVPSLRERRADIPDLTMHFVKLCSLKLNRNVTAVADDVFDVLQQHSWPGNVRELRSTVSYAVSRAIGNILTADLLPLSCVATNVDYDQSTAPPVAYTRNRSSKSGQLLPFMSLTHCVERLMDEEKPDLYREIIHEVDRHILSAAMTRFRGRQVRAAEILGMSRMTLRTKLRSFGML